MQYVLQTYTRILLDVPKYRLSLVDVLRNFEIFIDDVIQDGNLLPSLY